LVDLLDLLSAVGGLGGLSLIICLAYWLGRKFTEIDSRFKLIDDRFKLVDDRFDRLERRIDRLGAAFLNYQEFFVEFLAHEGVVRSWSRELLVGEARRTIGLGVLNPLSRDELKKIEEYLDKSEKDTITLREAEEFRDLARKFVMEYGEHVGAWKLHMYATITLALTRRKYLEESRKKLEGSDDAKI
jgi:hypothetical protein